MNCKALQNRFRSAKERHLPRRETQRTAKTKPGAAANPRKRTRIKLSKNRTGPRTNTDPAAPGGKAHTRRMEGEKSIENIFALFSMIYKIVIVYRINDEN